jgi:hypothetical protein
MQPALVLSTVLKALPVNRRRVQLWPVMAVLATSVANDRVVELLYFFFFFFSWLSLAIVDAFRFLIDFFFFLRLLGLCHRYRYLRICFVLLIQFFGFLDRRSLVKHAGW